MSSLLLFFSPVGIYNLLTNQSSDKRKELGNAHKQEEEETAALELKAS